MYYLLCSDLLSALGYGQILPLLNLSLLQRGLSLSVVATGASLLLVVCFVSSLPAGMLADRFGCKPALIAGALLQAASAFGQVTTATPLGLYAASLAGGLALALFSSAKVPLLAQLAPEAKVGAAIARSRAAGGLGCVAGAALAAALCLHDTGLRLALWVGVLVTCLAVIPLLWLPNKPATAKRNQRRNTHRAASLLPLQLGVLFLASVGYSLLTPFINLLLSLRGFSPATISASFSLWQLLPLVAYPCTIWLSHLNRKPLPFALLALAVCTLCLAYPLPKAFWWGLWLCWQAALTIAQCLMHTSLAKSTRKATSFAGLSMLQTMAAVIGTQGGGLLLPVQPWLYLVSASCCIGACALLSAQHR